VQFWGGLLRRPLSRVNPGSGRYLVWPQPRFRSVEFAVVHSGAS